MTLDAFRSAVLAASLVSASLCTTAFAQESVDEPRAVAAWDTGWVEGLLASDRGNLGGWLAAAEERRLQVLVGVLERDATGRLALVQHGFRVDAEYFYPASTVKTLAALATLEWLNELAADGRPWLDEHTPLRFSSGAELVEDETNLAGGVLTIAHEIRKLSLVSDNPAFNRLYDLVGPDELHRRLHEHGLWSARLVHRLSLTQSNEERRVLPAFELGVEPLVFELPERRALLELPPLELPGLEAGKAHLVAGERVDAPFDFTDKNSVSLLDLQEMLVQLLHPELSRAGRGWNLSPAQRDLVVEAMTLFPRESSNPRYDGARYPDDFVKFFQPGLERVVPKERLVVRNKVGLAYGFLVDNAYIEDTRTGRGFYLAATCYVNPNEVLNDNDYAYDTLALPFMADLAEVLARELLVR